MAVLTKYEILEALKKKELEFSPELDAFQVQPHAIDLRLGFEFKIPKTWQMTDHGRESMKVDYLEAPNVDSFHVVKLQPGQFFEILPHEFVIVSTMEEIALNSPNLMGILYPRTSFNRRGLSVNLSGIIDVGYRGHLIIPIRNNTDNQTIKLYPGERMCQVIFETLSSSLKSDDMFLHGISKPKYQDSKPGEQAFKSDSEAEVELIRTGRLEELKKKYPVE